MPALGPHAGPVLGAYGVTLALIALLVLVSWWRAARVRAALSRAETQAERSRAA